MVEQTTLNRMVAGSTPTFLHLSEIGDYDNPVNTITVPSSVMLNAGQEQFSDTIEVCSVCEGSMREVKGKWACTDESCAKYGVEQKAKGVKR